MTRVTLIGAHGQIARLLTRRLVTAGVEVTGVIRDAGQAADIESDGGVPLVFDIEGATPRALAEAIGLAEAPDALVFAAGAGPGSGVERKATVDRDGAIATADAAALLGTERVVQISFHGADQPVADTGDESWTAYHDAKRDADDHLRGTHLDFLIVRPASLHDGAAGGVEVVADDAGSGRTARELVADVIAEALTGTYPSRTVLGIVDGETPVAEALAAL